MIDTYTLVIQEHQNTIKELDKISSFLGYSKLVLVIVDIVLFYIAYTRRLDTIYYGFTFLLIAIFIGLWVWQTGLQNRIHYHQKMVAITQQYIDRLSGAWIDFEDIGEEFIDPNHPYSSDLDIVGKKSLFQFLNISHTYHGRKQFSDDLLAPKYTNPQIKQRQLAIEELQYKNSFVTNIEADLLEIGTSDAILNIIDLIKNKNTKDISNSLKMAIRYIPIVSLISFVISLRFKILWLVIISFGLIIGQGIVWILSIPKLQGLLQPISKVPFKLGDYSKVFTLIEKEDFSSLKLQEIKGNLSSDDLSAINAIADLERLVSMTSVSSNILIYGLLNVFFLWDYRCMFKLLRWQDTYANHCQSWFVTLGELESLMSFSVLPVVIDQTTYPTICNKPKYLHAIGLGHPLLHGDQRVCNNFISDQQITIISGSNMSGKTTFMRTVGINILLAKTGSPVLAKNMTTSIFTIITSMRIADDLNEGISTFYAELKRIKLIIEQAKEDNQVFFLIDEIFRGTNSKDRLDGAKTVLEKLDSQDVIGMITTHDLELCKLQEKNDHICNYHFSEEYKDNKIIFDYLLKKGVSTTTNAKFLMQLVGIL